MVNKGNRVTCYNRAGHHVSGAEYDTKAAKEYKGIRLKKVPTIEKKGLAAVSSSFFAAIFTALGHYNVVHIHAEGPAFFCWIPKLFRKKVIVTVHGLDWSREKWKSCLLYTSPHFSRKTDMEQLRQLKAGVRELAHRKGLELEISLGQELRYFEELPLYLEQGRALTLAESRYALVEFKPGDGFQTIRRAVREPVSYTHLSGRFLLCIF